MVENAVGEVHKGVTDSCHIAHLEEELKREKASHAEDVGILKARIEELMKKYTEALEEIARLKSILNNNSSNNLQNANGNAMRYRREEKYDYIGKLS